MEWVQTWHLAASVWEEPSQPSRDGCLGSDGRRYDLLQAICWGDPPLGQTQPRTWEARLPLVQTVAVEPWTSRAASAGDRAPAGLCPGSTRRPASSPTGFVAEIIPGECKENKSSFPGAMLRGCRRSGPAAGAGAPWQGPGELGLGSPCLPKAWPFRREVSSGLFLHLHASALPTCLPTCLPPLPPLCQVI